MSPPKLSRADSSTATRDYGRDGWRYYQQADNLPWGAEPGRRAAAVQGRAFVFAFAI